MWRSLWWRGLQGGVLTNPYFLKILTPSLFFECYLGNRQVYSFGPNYRFKEHPKIWVSQGNKGILIIISGHNLQRLKITHNPLGLKN